MRYSHHKRLHSKPPAEEGNHLKSGYTFDSDYGAIYCFGHIPLQEAEKIVAGCKHLFVVETINWSHADGNSKMVHHNRYFALTLPSAIALAASLTIASIEVVEEVIAIRPATETEDRTYDQLSIYYEDKMPKALGDIPQMTLPSPEVQ